jgi:hypothetical protein
MMQKALRDAGLTEELIAKKVLEGLDAERTFVVGGEKSYTETAPDYTAQHNFLKTGAELLDAFPAKKRLHGIVDLEELLDQAEKEAVAALWGDAAEDAV